MLSLFSNRARPHAATALLLGLSLTVTAGGVETLAPADGSVAALDGALARARHELAVKRDKLKRHLLPERVIETFALLEQPRAFPVGQIPGPPASRP